MKRDLVFCLLLTVIVLLFLNRGVRMEGIFFGADEIASDLVHFSYPYREFWATDYLKKGQVPLWNPYVGGGLPILAEAQTGIFYPPAIILYYFLPVPVAFNWLIISSFIFIAIGMYFYAKEMGLTRIPSFFTALIFILSGFMWGHLRHVPIITALTTMPLMFLAVEEIIRGARLSWMLILAVLTAISFLAGHYTTTYLILLVLSIYFILRLKGNNNLKLPLYVFGAIILSGLIAAVQLLPSLELVKYSTRFNVDVGFQELWGSTFGWKHLLLFINPGILGDPSRGTWNMQQGNFWENVGYLGIFPLVLCLLALTFGLKREKKISLSLKVCFILSLVLVFGYLTPVYRFFVDWVPGFSFTRIPGRFLLFVDFFGALLAGFGLKIIAARIQGWKKNVFIGLIVFISLIDLFYFGYPFNTVIPLSFFSEPESVKFLSKDKSLFRVLSSEMESWGAGWIKAGGWRGNLDPYIAQRELLPPDYNLYFRIPSPSIIYELSGHFSVKRVGELDTFLINAFSQGVPKNVASKLSAIANVKYILKNKELDNFSGIDLVYKYETNPGNLPIYIYQNKSWLPRAYFVGKGENFSNIQDLLKKMLQADFEHDKEVLLEGDTEALKTEGRAKVNIESYEDEKVIIDVEAKDAGYLVLSDTYYPGWKAYIDGLETRIYQANYAYRAVQVPSGDHTVVFSYDPISYKIGKGISLGSLGFLAVVGLLSLRRKNEQKRA